MSLLQTFAAARRQTSTFAGGRGVTSAVVCTEAWNWGGGVN